MHCTRSAAPVTERAIRRIVPELRAKGYRFVKAHRAGAEAGAICSRPRPLTAPRRSRCPPP
ncbi:hypothetical protein AB0C99_36705, partial [Streptomyces sp. NPDC048659]